MTLLKYLSYWEDIFFSFFLKFVLLQFKFIPAEFKYRRDSNGLKIQFRTLTKTDARIHFTSYVFMYLCLPIWAPVCAVVIQSQAWGAPKDLIILRNMHEIWHIKGHFDILLSVSQCKNWLFGKALFSSFQRCIKLPISFHYFFTKKLMCVFVPVPTYKSNTTIGGKNPTHHRK